MKKKRRRTNIEFLQDLCNFSDHGALAQCFILQAIQIYAEKVARSTPDQYPATSIVHPEAWIGVAREIASKFEERNKV